MAMAHINVHNILTNRITALIRAVGYITTAMSTRSCTYVLLFLVTVQ